MTIRPRHAVPLALATLLALAVALAQPAGAADANAGEAATAAAPLTIQQAMMRWTRSGDRSYTDAAGTAVHMRAELTLAHVTLFEAGDQPVPPGIADGTEVVFFLTESIHYGDLPEAPTRFQLYVDAAGPIDPAEVVLINPDPHHRVHRVVYRATSAADGSTPPLVGADTANVALSAVGGSRPLVLAWDLHGTYEGPPPLDLASADVLRISVTPYGFAPALLELTVDRPVILVFSNPTDEEHHFHAEYLPIGDSLRWLSSRPRGLDDDDALRAAAQFDTHICESEFGYCPTGAWVHLHANPGGRTRSPSSRARRGIFGVSCPIHPDVLGDIVVRIERHAH
jgi:hypothetical protein